MANILVVDDNPDIIIALELLLSLHDHKVVSASDKASAVLALTRQNIDLVIQDMNFANAETSGEEGKSLFHQLRAVNENIPIILITAWTQLETAIELVKAGAVDYLPKPWDDQKLVDLVAQYALVAPTEPKVNDLVIKSPEMLALYAKAEKVADSQINILITGANGAGKEKLADHIHQHSSRSDKPFIKINMGALPADLMEAELFGAEKGAYTGANEKRIGRFEAADGGTLFLDEIGNLSLSGQMKLLRVLQTGEFERLGSSETQKVDVRVISATNENLPLAIKQGSFRQDLFYRLNVIELTLPSLKQRKADILPLAQHFVGPEYILSDSLKHFLLAQDWPGNVRELENFCHRAKALASSKILELDEATDNHQVQISEQQQIEEALKKHNNVIKYAAEELGLSRQALYRRIEKYQIEV